MNPLPHPAVWKGQTIQASPLPSVSTSFRALDRELPGQGWPTSTLIELLVKSMGIGEFRFIAPTLRQLTQAGKRVVLLAPPHLPYGPALAAMGIDVSKLLIVQTDKPIDKLWAVEQSIKSNQFGAFVTWLDAGVKPELIRRLQLAATSAQGLVFVFRPFAAQEQASPAPLRLLLLPRRYPDLAVQIIKRRGPVMSAPIDIAVPIPGSGLRPIDDHQAIIASPSQVPSQVAPHAVDRLRSAPPLLRPVLPATSRHGSTQPN